MGRIGFESLSDAKSHLVLEICSISTTPIATCSHRHHCKHLVNSHFIDWYRILGVAEDAGLELIKRRYHKLALQLHPDKNKHPKAEVAFKLVSEAYSCLSDNVKRIGFNSERWKHMCIECNRVPYSNANPMVNISQHSSKPKAQEDPLKCSKSNGSRSMQILKDIRNRMKEEIRVIEHCLKVNNRRESPVFNPSNNKFQSENEHKIQRETPIFEPSEYVLHGYPHLRSEVYREPERFRQMKRESLKGRRGSYDSPVFENKSETGRGRFREVFKTPIY